MLYPLSYQGSFQLSRPACALKPARIYHTGVLNFLARSFSGLLLHIPLSAGIFPCACLISLRGIKFGTDVIQYFLGAPGQGFAQLPLAYRIFQIKPACFEGLDCLCKLIACLFIA